MDPTDFLSDCVSITDMDTVSRFVLSLVPLHITKRVVRLDGSTEIRTQALRSVMFSPWTLIGSPFPNGTPSQKRLLSLKRVFESH